jgi:hypothetical protein
MVGAEFSPQRSPHELDHERGSAGEQHEQERDAIPENKRMNAEPEAQVKGDPHQGKQRDSCVPVGPQRSWRRRRTWLRTG